MIYFFLLLIALIESAPTNWSTLKVFLLVQTVVSPWRISLCPRSEMKHRILPPCAMNFMMVSLTYTGESAAIFIAEHIDHNIVLRALRRQIRQRASV